MPTATTSIAQSNRDGREGAPTGTPVQDYSGTYVACSRNTSTSMTYYQVFELIFTMPAGIEPEADIASAYLTGWCSVNNSLYATIYGDATINPANLQSSPAIYSRSRTTANVRWEATLTLDALNSSPNIASIIQEFVDDPDFEAGDEIGIIFIADIGTAARCYFAAFDSSSNPEFELEITYANTIPDVDPTPVSGSTIDFGTLPTGSTSDESIVVENVGGVNLTLSSPSITGDASADYSIISPSFPATVTPGNSVTITIRATANDEGARGASLSITTNDPDEGTLSYTLTYTGISSAAVSTVPGDGATIDFGSIQQATTGAYGIVVYEVGADDLELQSVSITGTNNADFTVANAFPLTISNGGDPVTVLVQFTPSGTGTRTATLTITTSAPDNPSLIYSLTGIGVAAIDIAPERGVTHKVSYFVTVRDNDTGNITAEFGSDELEALRYERKLNDVGVCQVSIHADHRYAAMLTVKDALIDITRVVITRDELTTTDEGTFIVRMFRWFEDENDVEWIVVSGYSLEYVLLQRVIDPRNDPLTAGGFTTKSGPADTVMVSLVNEQAGANANPDQIVPYLTEVTPAGIGETVGGRWAWEGLLDVLIALADSGAVDFRVERASGIALQFVAEVIGADLTRASNDPDTPYVYFAPEFGNMQRPDLTIDYREEKTAVYLLGQGAGEHVDIYERLSSSVAESRFSYAAVVKDARQVEDGDVTQYLTQAVNEITRQAAKITFTFEVNNPSRQYRILWNLGDWVTSAWHEQEFDMRIRSIKVDVTPEGESVVPVMDTRI